MVPVFNREGFVVEAVTSALEQSWTPLEVVVVDDGSTDATPEVLERFGSTIHVLRQPNRGVAAARNSGIAASQGELVVHLDSDDVLPPESVRLRVEALLEDPGLHAATGHVEQFLDPGMEEALRERFACPSDPLPGVTMGALLVRRSFMHEVGLVDESFRNAADMDWLMRAQEAGMRMRILPDVVLLRRIHGANLGVTSGEAAKARLRVLKAGLDRRREG